MFRYSISLALGLGLFVVTSALVREVAAQETHTLDNPTQALGTRNQTPNAGFQNYRGYYRRPMQSYAPAYRRRSYYRGAPNYPYDSFRYYPPRYYYGYYGNFGYPGVGFPYWYYARYGAYPTWYSF